MNKKKNEEEDGSAPGQGGQTRSLSINWVFEDVHQSATMSELGSVANESNQLALEHSSLSTAFWVASMGLIGLLIDLYTWQKG